VEGFRKVDDLLLAFDVGGTRIKSGVVDAAGKMITHRIDPTEGHRGADSLLARMITIGKELAAGLPAGCSPRAIGVAFTGVIDPDKGEVLLLNGKIPEIEGVKVGPHLSNAFGIPCWVDNDTRAYTIGEWQHGAGKGFDNVVCITLGTGIGSGVITHGQVLHTQGMVGGILGGHFTVDYGGPLCSCGNRGCLEAVASVPALLTFVRDHLARGYPSILTNQVGNDLLTLDAKMILSAVDDRDRLATFAFERWTQHIGAGLVTLIHAYDPDVVIIGGGVMHASDTILPPIQRYVSEHAWTWPKGRTSVRASALGDDAGLIGSAALATIQARADPKQPARADVDG
jgi:glucokinase